ncbi:MAG: MBL fold metallo-hydrolase [Acidilobaceae archaeon]|nr:MBL fold metallo-hydrolase [Acidilobaceae archaeon]MCX8164989.1 MBL fold metallo-hydrolase [Acidilobaceae archaeon]MDW7974494.1 MBL fold metallo-hydrolase [Sulfolobales archaeon]
MPHRIELIALGTGATLPTPERFMPSFFLRDSFGLKILLDAGEGVQVRMSQAEISPLSIDVIAITHDHGDHVNGLPGLLQSMQVNRREERLKVIAPAAVAEALERVELGFPLEIVRLSGRGELLLREQGGDKVSIRWFPVCHTVEAYGFSLEWSFRPRVDAEKLSSLGLRPGAWLRKLFEEGKVRVGELEVTLEEVAEGQGGLVKVVYTGDTSPCRSVVEEGRGARVLIHDSTFSSELAEEARERGHSTSEQAAEVAKEAQAELLLLTHVSSRYRGLEERRLLLEARRVFYRTVLARDLMKLTLSNHKV